MPDALATLTGPRPLGLTRIIVGVAAVIRGIVAWDILTRFDTPLVVRMPVVGWLPAPGGFASFLVVAVWLTAAVALTFGWRVTMSGTVLGASIAAYLFADYQTYSNHLYLMLLLVILLVIADSGAALTPKRSDRTVVTWPITLIKLQISLVYVFAAITKLNEDFLTGRVLASTVDGGIFELPDALRTPDFLTIVAVGAVVNELFVAIFLWRPRFRGAAIVLGGGLHVTIAMLIAPVAELAVFSLLMLSTYPLFLDTPALRRKASELPSREASAGDHGESRIEGP